MGISVEGLTKLFGGRPVLRDVSIDMPKGELVGLIGPSGSGKTTLLRIIAGLDHASAGRVVFGGEDMADKHVRERRVGFVFQHYALFRHMSVFENVAFGLRVRRGRERPSESEIRGRVLALLDRMQLQGLQDRMPSQLSGGQRQRVALARSLAIEPRVLLLDEPFGALDARVRAQLRRWLRQVHNETGLTTVFVTHDQEEAFEIADRVVVLNDGRIEQSGTPDEVWEKPASPFVCEFLGETNRIECTARNGIAEVLGGDFEIAGPRTPFPVPAVAYVRPQDVAFVPSGARNGVSAIVQGVWSAGARVQVDLAVEGLPRHVQAVLARAAQGDFRLQAGTPVTIGARAARVFLLDNGNREAAEDRAPASDARSDDPEFPAMARQAGLGT